MWYLLALEVGVATKLSFAKLCLEQTSRVLIFDFLFLLPPLCYVLGYLAAYLGVPCLVIYAQEENKHFE